MSSETAMIFVTESIYIVYYTYWFTYIKWSLHLWNKLNLIIVNYLFDVLLNLTCKYFVGKFFICSSGKWVCLSLPFPLPPPLFLPPSPLTVFISVWCNFIKGEYDLKSLLHYQYLLSSLGLILADHMHLEIHLLRLSNLVKVRIMIFRILLVSVVMTPFSSLILLNWVFTLFLLVWLKFFNLFIFKELALCFIDSFFFLPFH